MCKPHRCPHIAMTGNICVYCPGGPDSDFEYSTQSYTGYEVCCPSTLCLCLSVCVCARGVCVCVVCVYVCVCVRGCFGNCCYADCLLSMSPVQRHPSHEPPLA